MQTQAEAIPAMANALKTYVISQFGNPRGLVGALAGHIMAARASNLKRNLWTIELMDLKATDHVLEIGFGPRYALEQVCALLKEGKAIGLDRSETMLRMALRRNRQRVSEGRLELVLGSIEEPETLRQSSLSGPFDTIYAVNVAMFWREPVETLGTLRERLTQGGRVLLTFQPRTGTRTDAASKAAGEKMAEQMRNAGFAAVEIECLESLSPMAVCVIGRNA